MASSIFCKHSASSMWIFLASFYATFSACTDVSAGLSRTFWSRRWNSHHLSLSVSGVSTRGGFFCAEGYRAGDPNDF